MTATWNHRRSPRRAALFMVPILLMVCQIGTTQETGAPVIEDAEPYQDDEFADWALDLRRAEIVATGSFPLTILASRLIYGLGRFTVQSIIARGLAPAYLPPLFAPPGGVPYSRDDNLWILLGAVSLSGVIAAIDYVLGLEEPPSDSDARP